MEKQLTLKIAKYLRAQLGVIKGSTAGISLYVSVFNLLKSSSA
jgi:hypothetical protein